MMEMLCGLTALSKRGKGDMRMQEMKVVSGGSGSEKREGKEKRFK